ncbi:MAG: NYN domain-containing protein [Schleiferiaceae bacterium]|nr:NYN domain-containing protein [Schleiferiaceae bacterium]
MSAPKKSELLKIGVFYDGNYFLHVSNYYNYNHSKRSRISISGLHEFIKEQVAYEENVDSRLCKIVDAHYFRGRLNAQEASSKGSLLYYDRVFDDILMTAGVTTHYLPIRNFHGSKHEKGIDVWLSLEAFEMAFYKQFDVLVLIASDSDFVPLIRKLNTLGTRVMLLSWDFEFTNDEGQQRHTRTSDDLLDEVSYPYRMHDIIDQGLANSNYFINNLFVQHHHPTQEKVDDDFEIEQDGEVYKSTILSLKNGFGFIKFPENNLFFHYTSLIDTDFNDLEIGDAVEFVKELADDGNNVARNVKLRRL